MTPNKLCFQQHPFIFLDPNAKDKDNPYAGYCIDLLEEIRKLIKFDYVIYEAPDKKFGYMDDKGQWNGIVKELIDKVGSAEGGEAKRKSIAQVTFERIHEINKIDFREPT